MLEGCSHCGLCKAGCPVFAVLREETRGPRGKALLIEKDFPSEVLYECTLCKGCERECPAGVELGSRIREARERLVKQGLETEANRRMIVHIREFGNPFGQVREGEMPKELYCC